MSTTTHLPCEVDWLVIGGGAGGMTAALAGALHGMNVLLCEATQQVGGTTATSAGTIWVPCNTPSKNAGYSDSVEEATRYLEGLAASDEGRELRQAYLQSGPAVLDELARRTQVQFMAAGPHPDYVDIAGSKPAGRAMAPLPFDGRTLGADFDRIRPPMKEFMVLGGMMVGKMDIGHLVNDLGHACEGALILCVRACCGGHRRQLTCCRSGRRRAFAERGLHCIRFARRGRCCGPTAGRAPRVARLPGWVFSP